MSSYRGRHAELYDTFYGDKPYGEEAAFVDNCLRQYSIGSTQNLLELACGTGSHAFELKKYGYNIVASDYSEDMLNCARVKAKTISSDIDFRLLDMRELDLQDRFFDAVICLFDSIGYVKTNEALEKVLGGIYRNLRKDGLFMFEFWHAGAMMRNYDPLRIRRFRAPDVEILRISETRLDYVRQLAFVEYDIYEFRNDGTYCNIKETQVNRYFLVQEMNSLLTKCLFKPLKWFAGFTEDENITEDTWHVICIARKR